MPHARDERPTGEALADAMEAIREAAALALGSSDPEHWQAALADILDTVRRVTKDNI